MDRVPRDVWLSILALGVLGIARHALYNFRVTGPLSRLPDQEYVAQFKFGRAGSTTKPAAPNSFRCALPASAPRHSPASGLPEPYH